MKMTDEHYRFIKEQLSCIPHNDLIKHFKFLKTQKNVKDIHKRFRWDCFAARRLSPFASSHLYPYLNDDHIDTALRQIAKELRFPTEV